jgi:hypothetical protein
MSVLNIKVTTKRPDSYLKTLFQGTKGNHTIINSLTNFLSGIATGSESPESSTSPLSVHLSVQGQATRASGTITFTGASTANDTVIINGATFTCVASGATGDQWVPGATATTSAANLAAAINASVTALVAGYVTAANVAGVLTVYSAFYGIAGNQTTIAEGVDAGSKMAVSGAKLTGGAADATAKNLSF